MKNRAFALPVAAGLLLTACASLPSGPSVMVLPGSGKSFEQFQTDDAVCRGWAERQTGTTPQQVATETTVSGAAIGTVLGTAAGAAIGAASGSAGTGAAVGAGAGLLGGTAIGASSAWGDTISIQRRYDMTYMQCMYSKGNQIPVARGSQPAYQPPPPPPPPPPAQGPMPPGVPPPPPGSPPPPPPGTSR